MKDVVSVKAERFHLSHNGGIREVTFGGDLSASIGDGSLRGTGSPSYPPTHDERTERVLVSARARKPDLSRRSRKLRLLKCDFPVAPDGMGGDGAHGSGMGGHGRLGVRRMREGARAPMPARRP